MRMRQKFEDAGCILLKKKTVKITTKLYHQTISYMYNTHRARHLPAVPHHYVLRNTSVYSRRRQVEALGCSQRACSLTSLKQEELQNNQKARGNGYPLILPFFHGGLVSA